MTWLSFTLAALATARLVRLATTDHALEAARVRAGKGRPLVAYFVRCWYCVGFWLAWAPVVAVVVWPDNRAVTVVVGALAANLVAGWVGDLEALVDRVAKTDDD